MSCNHESCGSIEKVWLPFVVNGQTKGLKSHSYCIHCGVIKNLSYEKLRDIGYYMNVLSKINKHVIKISKVQLRLIALELEKNDDFYSITTFT